MKQLINLIGYGSGVAANNPDCALGPWYLYYHPALFQDKQLNIKWETIITATSNAHGLDVMGLVEEKVAELGRAVMPLAFKQDRFCVIGGDHSSAIGTWNAVAHANRKHGDIGLIWIDAHMDCHTPVTSETHNIHGMPLAHLLGEGTENLIHLFDQEPALKPENLCLIGVRSYESGERQILERLGVRVIKMDEIKQRGMDTVLAEACQYVSKATCGFGISLDLDGIDPIDAPGVGCPVPHGLSSHELIAAFKTCLVNQTILGLEIVEYNPLKDINSKTAQLAVELLDAIYG